MSEQEESRDVSQAESSALCIYEDTSENTCVNAQRDTQIRKRTNTKKINRDKQLRDTETQHETHTVDSTLTASGFHTKVRSNRIAI